MKKKFRLFNRIRAFVGGYFWLPCPLCGEYFGGHEWLLGDRLMMSWNHREGVCPDCGDRARKLNEEFMKNNPSGSIYAR